MLPKKLKPVYKLAIQTLLCLGVLSPAISAAELLNGNAETGDTSGWTLSDSNDISAVTTQAQQHPSVTPFEGSYFFTFAKSASISGSMQQTGTGLLMPGTTLILSGRVQTEYFVDSGPQDNGEAILTIYDSVGATLATATSGQLLTVDESWQPFSIQLVVPPEATTWEVQLLGSLQFGSFINLFWDNLSLVNIDLHSENVPLLPSAFAAVLAVSLILLSIRSLPFRAR